MDYANIVQMLWGAFGGVLASLVLSGVFSLALFRHKVAITDLRERVLTLYNRSANQVRQSRNTPSAEELAQLLPMRKEQTRKFDNDPFGIDR